MFPSRWAGPRKTLARSNLTSHDEVRAAVAPPGLLVARGVERLLLAVGHRLQAIARHAQAHQVLARDARALVAQREVVVYGAALVGVSLHRHLRRPVVLQPEGVFLQDRACLVAQRGLVVI